MCVGGGHLRAVPLLGHLLPGSLGPPLVVYEVDPLPPALVDPDAPEDEAQFQDDHHDHHRNHIEVNFAWRADGRGVEKVQQLNHQSRMHSTILHSNTKSTFS